MPQSGPPLFTQDIGAGVPLVLIHGGLSDGPGSWAPQTRSLATQHRLLIPDRRGAGRSPKEPRPYTIRGDAVDMLDLMDRAGVRQAHIAGFSYGGLVAVEMSCQAPDRLLSLHLIEPPYLSLLPADPSVSALTASGAAVFRHAGEQDPEDTARDFFRMLVGERGVERMVASASWSAIVAEATRVRDEQEPSTYPQDRLHHLTLGVPVRVYSGGRSHQGLQRVARRLSALLPGSELIVFPDAPHAVQFAGNGFDTELLRVTGGAGGMDGVPR